VGGRHYNHVRTEAQQLVEIGADPPAMLFDEPLGPDGHRIGGAEQSVVRPQRPRPLAAD